MVLTVKFVETKNLRQSDAFGSVNVYTYDKSFADTSSDYKLAESKWLREMVTFIAAALITNEEVLAHTLTGTVAKAEDNIDHNQNIAMADLD
ncbi:MAG: hypothetical protein ACQPRI_05620 [Solitalea-like symbiont of Tyrophagus putrescentiae]